MESSGLFNVLGFRGRLGGLNIFGSPPLEIPTRKGIDQKIGNQSEGSNCITACVGTRTCSVLRKRKQDIGANEQSLVELPNKKILKETLRSVEVCNSETGS